MAKTPCGSSEHVFGGERRITPEQPKNTYAFDHTIKINPELLETILRDVIKQQTGQDVTSLRFEYDREYDRFGTYEDSKLSNVVLTLGK